MTTEEITQHLISKGVKPTANRIIVLRALHEANRPMSLKALEMKLLSMDKSSIFRVLTLFLEQPHHWIRYIRCVRFRKWRYGRELRLPKPNAEE